jgi:modulator of FtsH protease
MQPQFQMTGQATREVSLQQNRVLRNTFMLLALTMVPTVLGALAGIQMQFTFMSGSPMMSFLLFLGIAFAFMWGIERTKNSGMGVVLLLGFTFLIRQGAGRRRPCGVSFNPSGCCRCDRLPADPSLRALSVPDQRPQQTPGAGSAADCRCRAG